MFLFFATKKQTVLRKDKQITEIEISLPEIATTDEIKELSEFESIRSAIEAQDSMIFDWIGCDVRYSMIWHDLFEFDRINEHFQHPKMLESVKTKAINSCKHKYCSSFDSSLICEHLREQIANKLQRAAINRGILASDVVLGEIVSLLYLSDSKLAELAENSYKWANNWFINIYGYYLWVNLIICDYLVLNLQRLESLDSNINDTGDFLSYLCLVFEHYQDLIKLLLIANCCLNRSIFLPIFYKLFEASLGSKLCDSFLSVSAQTDSISKGIFLFFVFLLCARVFIFFVHCSLFFCFFFTFF